MERYDGKTRKDDVKKWLLIGIPAAIVVIGFFVGMNLIKKAIAPDYTIVTMMNGTLNDTAKAMVEEAAAAAVGDKNENGKVKIGFKEVTPAAYGGYGDAAATLFAGDYVFFLITDPTPWTSDLLAVKTNLSDAKFWQAMDTNQPIYGCILNTDEDAVAEAQRIIELLQEQDTP